MTPFSKMTIPERKRALDYCINDLGLNKKQTADQLQSIPQTVIAYAKRFGFTFPDGHATRDKRLQRETVSAMMTKKHMIARGEPVEINGVVWFPGEPTFHAWMNGG